MEVVAPLTIVLACSEPPDDVTVATPALNATSSPVPKSTVTADPTLTSSSSITIPVPDAVTFNRFDPSIAGKVPVKFPAGNAVRFAPPPTNCVAVITPVA